ncbi:hypothetical protein Zmor_017554 [Zophobas morio]|uniref:Uncharacterized protein n=1 Tax=Zophobas morio TaxID=2755281 RepID=A0AA38MCP7_9CUCU|nr:hypothetical protein Zmor_017554 [Zophobas morio]
MHDYQRKPISLRGRPAAYRLQRPHSLGMSDPRCRKSKESIGNKPDALNITVARHQPRCSISVTAVRSLEN